MIFSIWDKINKLFQRKPITSVPLPASQAQIGRSNPQQTGNTVSVYNAQSWNKETHPNGRGDSYLVDEINYDGNGTLDVKYRDGFTAEYDDISPQDAKDFAQADSKGRWALSHLWDKPYRQVP
jgi:hypothetical protein